MKAKVQKSASTRLKSVAAKKRRIQNGRGGTRAEILSAAGRILASRGYARLTMRAVAGEAGCAVGNLVYYFPTKRELIHALIGSLVIRYQGKSAEYLRDAGTSQQTGFAGLVRWFIEDSVEFETSRLFRELWTMALHDEAIATEMNGFYTQSHEVVIGLLTLAKPGLDRGKAQDIVQLMGLISEGANVLYATVPGSKASLKRVAKLAGALLVFAAEQASTDSRDADTDRLRISKANIAQPRRRVAAA